MKDNIVADSSFYCCYESDINKRDILLSFLDCYQFNLGKRISEELPLGLKKDNRFLHFVRKFDGDYFELVKPFFGRSEKHKKDGEYEAIGIAYHLNKTNQLKYLVIDDKRAYKFTLRHFSILSPYLTRTIGFVRLCCYCDKTLSYQQGIMILNQIHLAYQNQNFAPPMEKKRPCSVDKKVYENILMPLIEQLKIDSHNG
jgi:hypothetical protein